jgi:hypothetical protein
MADPDAAADHPTISIKIIAMDDKDTPMGDEMHLTLDKSLTVLDLCDTIKEKKEKGGCVIPLSRMELFLPPMKVIAKVKWGLTLQHNSIVRTSKTGNRFPTHRLTPSLSSSLALAVYQWDSHTEGFFAGLLAMGVDGILLG